MSAVPSDAAERRRKQNREAQKKRRNALKVQIAELQAKNSELQAFKNSALWAKECPTLLSPPSAVRAPVLNGITRRGSLPPEQEAARNLGGGERSTAFQPYLQTLDDDLLRDMVTDWRTNPQSAASSGPEAHHEPDDLAKQNSDSGSTSCETGSTLPASTYLDPALGPLDKIKANAADDLMPLDPAMSFSHLGAFATRREQGAVMARRPSLASTGASRPDRRHGALRIAVANGQSPMVRLLLRHGADIDGRDDRGRTVLHEATESNDGDMARLLLQRGADAGAVDAAGMTPLDVAASLGNVEVAEVLLEACPD
ncbi:hypothetical protein CDD81_1767 [Ophiocordyceps australis]|uniref:Uncharacterized protein n=1 Tax=Ophiocordyceps australis TaxID=1399860 RepID=A0A2C5YFN4_9HYPO|nr:hypothetical protein CDD81_1767 [Ophiocordyceps australis]